MTKPLVKKVVPVSVTRCPNNGLTGLACPYIELRFADIDL